MVIVSEELSGPITLDDVIIVAGKKALAKEFADILAHEEGVCLGEDIEHLHRMRVAVRRSRVLLKSLKPYYRDERYSDLCIELKWFAGALGIVRDIDTFIESFEEMMDSMTKLMLVPVKKLLANRHHVRDGEMVTLRKEMMSSRYERLKKTLVSVVSKVDEHDEESPLVRDVLPVIIEKCFMKVVNNPRQVFRANPEELHRLRIRNKQFRYMTEFFENCFDDRIKNLNENQVTIQRLLGAIQDNTRDISYLSQNADTLSVVVQEPGDERSFNQLIDVLVQSRKSTHQKFLEFWKGFSVMENQVRIRCLIYQSIKLKENLHDAVAM